MACEAVVRGEMKEIEIKLNITTSNLGINELSGMSHGVPSVNSSLSDGKSLLSDPKPFDPLFASPLRPTSNILVSTAAGRGVPCRLAFDGFTVLLLD
jgi:hypothetical protein